MFGRRGDGVSIFWLPFILLLNTEWLLSSFCRQNSVWNSYRFNLNKLYFNRFQGRLRFIRGKSIFNLWTHVLCASLSCFLQLISWNNKVLWVGGLLRRTGNSLHILTHCSYTEWRALFKVLDISLEGFGRVHKITAGQILRNNMDIVIRIIV